MQISNEDSIITKIKYIFDHTNWGVKTTLGHHLIGVSGKSHTFDLLVTHENSIALFDAVVPHPNSIAAKYLAFSDTENRHGLYKYAVFDTELSHEDKVLISGVSDLISYTSIEDTNGKYTFQ